MRPPPPAACLALLLLLAVAALPHAASQLEDRPLELTGRPTSPRPAGAAAAAAAGSNPDERAGYFAIPNTQRRLFYWYFQVRGAGVQFLGLMTAVAAPPPPQGPCCLPASPAGPQPHHWRGHHRRAAGGLVQRRPRLQLHVWNVLRERPLHPQLHPAPAAQQPDLGRGGQHALYRPAHRHRGQLQRGESAAATTAGLVWLAGRVAALLCGHSAQTHAAGNCPPGLPGLRLPISASLPISARLPTPPCPAGPS